MAKIFPINRILKRMFCDKGKHWYHDVLSPDNGYHMCYFCNDTIEFTTIEYWALSRGLPSRPTIAYKIGRKLRDLYINTSSWAIIIFSLAFSLSLCIAPILAIIWFLRHW